MASKTQWRNDEAERLTLELQHLGITKPSEKVATKLLVTACIRAEERTRPVPSQKKAYKGVKFLFDLHLDMAIYFITELPLEWEKWKAQTKVWQQAKGKEAKNKAVPSIDRINDTDVDLKHYMRGNVRTASNKLNTEKAIEKMKKSRAFLVQTDIGKELVVGESVTAMASILGVKSHATAKRYSYSYKRLEPTATEEERKAQCKAHGITYETAEKRAERNKRMLAQIRNKQ